MTTRVGRLREALASIEDGDRVVVRHEIDDDEALTIGTFRGTTLERPGWASGRGEVQIRVLHVDAEYPGGTRRRSIPFVTVFSIEKREETRR